MRPRPARSTCGPSASQRRRRCGRRCSLCSLPTNVSARRGFTSSAIATPTSSRTACCGISCPIYLGPAPQAFSFSVGTSGKPHLSGVSPAVEFNLSHTDGLVLYAFTSDAPVGVDVEKRQPFPDALELAQRFFATVESAAIQQTIEDERVAGFLRCWTRKEALVKASGDGLSIALDAFNVLPLETTPVPGRAAWRAREGPARLVDSPDRSPARLRRRGGGARSGRRAARAALADGGRAPGGDGASMTEPRTTGEPKAGGVPPGVEAAPRPPRFRRILVLSQYYSPESGAAPIRLRATVGELQRLGFEVRVLTGMPNYPTGRIYPGFEGKWRMCDRIDGVPVTRMWLYPAAGKGVAEAPAQLSVVHDDRCDRAGSRTSYRSGLRRSAADHSGNPGALQSAAAPYACTSTTPRTFRWSTPPRISGLACVFSFPRRGGSRAC